MSAASLAEGVVEKPHAGVSPAGEDVTDNSSNGRRSQVEETGPDAADLTSAWLASYTQEAAVKHRSNFGLWTRWCEQHGVQAQAAAEADLLRYREHLSTLDLHRDTRRQRLASVRRFQEHRALSRLNPALLDVAAVAATADRPQRLDGALEQVGSTALGAAVHSWLATLPETNRDRRGRHLSHWLAFCHEHGHEVLTADVAAVEAYRDQLERTAGATGEPRLRALRDFHSHLVLRGHRTDHPAALVALTPTAPKPPSAALHLRRLSEVVASEPALEPVVGAWLEGYAAASKLQQLGHLRAWQRFCIQHGQSVLSADADVVHAYASAVKQSSTSSLYQRTQVGVVRAFYGFLVDHGHRQNDPSSNTSGRRRRPARLLELSETGLDNAGRELVAAFLLGFGENTRRSYIQSLRHWLTWCSEVGLDPFQAQRVHVDGYRTLLAETASAATVRHRLVVLRAFYGFALDEGVIGQNPARAVRMPRLPHLSPSVGLDREELRALLDQAQAQGPMEHALFTLLAFNGLRVTEALSLNVEHLSTSQGHRVALVERKGFAGTRQAVPLAPHTAEVLDTWLRVRTIGMPLSVGDAGRGPVFVTSHRRAGGQGVRRLSRETVWNRMKTLADRGVPHKADRLHPHDLRNAFITLSLDADVPLRDVQDSAGHASAETTRRYDTQRNNLNRHATYRLVAHVGVEATDD